MWQKYADSPRQATHFSAAKSYVAFSLVCQTLCRALGYYREQTNPGRDTRQYWQSDECYVAGGFKAV